VFQVFPRGEEGDRDNRKGGGGGGPWELGEERGCSARDWDRIRITWENPQSGCSEICASLKGPL
jgi:hypothetical protein